MQSPVTKFSQLCSSSGGLWGKFSTILEPGLRRSTLVLVAIQTALLTVLHGGLFISHEYDAAQNDLAYNAKIVAELLSKSIRTPLLFQDKGSVRKEIAEVLKNKEIASVKVFDADGVLFTEESPQPQRGRAITASANVLRQQLMLDDTFVRNNPDVMVLGKVVVSMDSAVRMEKTRALIIKLLAVGFVLWVVATYLGYLLMRQLTRSFSQLSVDMMAVERGELTVISTNYRDQTIAYLVGAINRLITALDRREKANIALSQQLLKETKSQLRRAEHTMQKKLTHANRLSSLGTMASYMAHEINNPVGAMILNLDLLKDAFEDSREILAEHYRTHGDFTLGGLDYQEYDETMPYLIDEMRNGAQRIKRIVEDLKRFAKNESVELNENIKMNDVVMSAIRLTSRKVRSSTDNLEINLTDPIPAVRGNTHQMEQVLINLILNACQAIPDTTRKILISTSLDEQARHVIVVVKDEGEGVAHALIPHLTDPFFTTKRERGGTGIGLAITAKIIKDHGGLISFESDVGQGMTVNISLPIVTEATENA
ncbi:HAMP domain-containing protein [bacterium]|nr:HAMP domain-containing protein [bacterium]